MIKFLRKLNRSRNHYFKIYKFKMRLKLICILSHRYTIRMRKKHSANNNVVIPFIGKGIGDAIVISGLIDILAKNDYHVSVVADRKTHFLFQEWKNIDNLFLYIPENEINTMQNLKEIGPFIFIDPHEITNSSINTFSIMRHTKPIKTIGFNNYSIYDDVISMSQPLGHISNKCKDLLQFMRVAVNEPYNYVIHIPEQNKKEAENLTSSISHKKIIALIPYGSVSTRYFSDEQLGSILSFFNQYTDDMHVIIIGEQDKIKDIKTGSNVSKNTYPSFFTAAQLIKNCDLVISPDTSIVHLSRIFDKKLVCLYPFKTVNNGADNADVWGPNYDNAVQVRFSETYLMDVDVDILINHIKRETNEIMAPIH